MKPTCLSRFYSMCPEAMAGTLVILAMGCLQIPCVAVGDVAGENTNSGRWFELGRFANGPQVLAMRALDNRWGLQVRDAGLACVSQPKPVQLEFYREVEHALSPLSRPDPQRWRFSTARPAGDWAKPGFDAARWSEGAGGFGSQGTPGAVIGTAWTTGDIWLRREFHLDQLPQGELKFWIHHDEDAEVYLNGVLATHQGGYSTGYKRVPVSREAEAALVKGRNTLAVHCQQTGGGQYIDVGLVEMRVFASSLASGYESFSASGAEGVGRALVPFGDGSRVEVEDRWRVEKSVLQLSRQVRVRGNAPDGFLSAITFPLENKAVWTNVQWFAPGMIYGGFDYLTDTAIGGRAHYQPSNFTVRIREDRLPAPVLAAQLADTRTLAVLNPAPQGGTTAADALDVLGQSLVDERFQFGAVGAEERSDGLALGYWFPGSEGEVTYAGNTYPGGQLHQWRRRHHPLRDGLVQQYQVAFRFGQAADFPQACRETWRWAWNTLSPALTRHNLESVRTNIVNVLSACVVEKDGRAGIPNFVDSVSKDLNRADRKAILGFTGKNLESAYYLLREAALDPSPRGQRLRRQAETIIASFVRLPVDPPVGEGFGLDDGKPRCAIGDREVFLRSFGDDIKALLKAYQHERKRGREHPEWLAWCRRFGDWLLTQQQTKGGFPRTWAPGTGQVVSASPNSSYNAIPMLVLLAQETGDQRYREAAIRAGDFCWSSGQASGRFVGGTIDNPDVLDKEAGTLSLEAYLALAEATGETRWIQRARAAADFAETWIYLWNVPIPEDDRNPHLHWKHGVPTTGLQLISTGHSLVDAYMAFDADEYARLYQRTGDEHYLAVARLLLHNTKNMVALPGRLFDLGQPGWQQEHWSLAPRRGYGLHRGWLPWVATSQLNGIFGVMDLEAEIRNQVLSADAN